MPERVALVTGGAGGIGRAITAALAADGRRVAVGDLVEADVDGASLSVVLDVTDTASVALAVDSVEAQLGPIDILVNNAGWDEMRPFLETDERFWDRVLEINFKGGLRTARRIVPGMAERGWGRVVNIGSDARRVRSSLESGYSRAKGAVIAFTKTLAREVARSGVTANTVCPGPTRTPMLASMDPKMASALERAVPMRRVGGPQDGAAAGAVVPGAAGGRPTRGTPSGCGRG